MGYVATSFDAMNFNFDILDHSSEVSLYPPTPPPLPNSLLELRVVEPQQGEITEIVLVNEPVELMKDEIVLLDSISVDTFDGDGVSLPLVSTDSIIESEPEIAIVLPVSNIETELVDVLPSVTPVSIIEPIIVVLPEPIEPIIEKEVEHEPEHEPEHKPIPKNCEINFDCLPMEVKDLYLFFLRIFNKTFLLNRLLSIFSNGLEWQI